MNNNPVKPKMRCAIYTRKSTEEGLDMEFNSLDAQRDACESYIASQRSEGWILVPDHYDDGGVSGGTLERPALKRLLADIAMGKIDIIVVYKIDRLCRSLLDFSKLVEVFEAHKVTFISVTQSFNTTSSMGRLTLNILLSFAQFEREVIGERIRDKFAASRKRGIWMGGHPPLGYAVSNRKLVIVPDEAAKVRRIFEQFVRIGSPTKLALMLRAEGMTTKGGALLVKSYLYRVLSNPVYIAEAVHKGVSYPGEHEAIIGRRLWDRVQAILAEKPGVRAARNRAQTPYLLKGLVFGVEGEPMTPSHTRSRGRLYRYYISSKILREGATACTFGRVPAADVERLVVDQLRAFLTAPELIVGTWRAAKAQLGDLSEADVRTALIEFGAVWEELFPAEQARIAQLLVQRVDVGPSGINLTLRTEGLTALAGELLRPLGPSTSQEAA